MTKLKKLVKQNSLLTSKKAKNIYIFIFFVSILFLIYGFAITPEKYNIGIGQIAPSTIVATKDVVDTVATEHARMEVANSIEPSYISVESVSDEVLEKLNKIIDEINQVQKFGRDIVTKEDSLDVEFFNFSQENIDDAKKMLLNVRLSDYQLRTLLNTTNEQIDSVSSDLRKAVQNTLKSAIREGRVQETISYLQQIIGYKTDINLLQNVVTPVLNACIKPNLIIDKDSTNAAREAAMEKVEPIVYQKGQNIVLEGNRINKNQYETIKSLGLLDDKTVDVFMYIATLIFIIVTVALIIIMMRVLKPRMIMSKNEVNILLICLCITSFFIVVARYINIYVAPILLAPFLITILLGSRAAFIGNSAIAILNVILLASTSNGTIEDIFILILIGLINGSIAISLLYKKQSRQRTIFAGIIASAANFIVVVLIGVFTHAVLDSVIVNALWSALGGAVALLLSLALEPILETMFNFPTENKLLELITPEQPLIRRLLLEAPGTYHHSIIVANLAESAAEKIGANTLIARCGAYYHDIGKLTAPNYFTENQIGDNPHAKEDAYKSAQIVISHTSNGYKLAKKYKLPEVILDIIQSHHGNSVAMYFYHEAVEASSCDEVDISKFRYPGPKPVSKEASIVMLADTIEAAVRSMKDHSQEAINEFILKLVTAKIKDT